MKKRLARLLVLLLLLGVPTGLLLCVCQKERASHELIVALRNNETGKALAALRAHADPNARLSNAQDPSLRSYLSHLWNQMRGVKSSSRPDPTALAVAILQDNDTVAEALLTGGARKEAMPYSWVDHSQVPMIQVAALHSNLGIIQALERHGWNMNEVNQDAQTALFFAGDAATIKALLAAGTRRDATDTNGWTALDYHLLNDEAACQVLIDLGAHDANALPVMIENDRVEMVEKLIGQGWKIETQNASGQTPLMVALGATDVGETVHWGAAFALLRHGANVNCRDKTGRTPLHLAAAGGGAPEMEMEPDSPKIVHTLLEHGANVNAQSQDGMTPLMVATLHLRPMLIKTLLQHGARVDIHTPNGETALSLAHKYVSPDALDVRPRAVIRLLQTAGATR